MDGIVILGRESSKVHQQDVYIRRRASGRDGTKEVMGLGSAERIGRFLDERTDRYQGAWHRRYPYYGQPRAGAPRHGAPPPPPSNNLNVVYGHIKNVSRNPKEPQICVVHQIRNACPGMWSGRTKKHLPLILTA